MSDLHERRDVPRLRLGIAAGFISHGGRQPVLLDDISQAGAHITLSRPETVSKGILQWLGFEVFAEVAWQDGEHCGLQFDKPLSPGTIVQTREAAPELHTDRSAELRKTAEAWVRGL